MVVEVVGFERDGSFERRDLLGGPAGPAVAASVGRQALGRPGEVAFGHLLDRVELPQEGDVPRVSGVVTLAGEQPGTQPESVCVLRSEDQRALGVGERGRRVGLLEKPATFEQGVERLAKGERAVARLQRVVLSLGDTVKEIALVGVGEAGEAPHLRVRRAALRFGCEGAHRRVVPAPAREQRQHEGDPHLKAVGALSERLVQQAALERQGRAVRHRNPDQRAVNRQQRGMPLQRVVEIGEGDRMLLTHV